MICKDSRARTDTQKRGDGVKTLSMEKDYPRAEGGRRSVGEPKAGRGLCNCGSLSCGGGVQNRISLELLIARYPRKDNGGLYHLRGSLRRASRPAGTQGGIPLGRHLLYGASHSGSGLNQARAFSQELLLPMSHSAWWVKKRVKGLWMVWRVHWSHAYTYHTHTTQHTTHNMQHTHKGSILFYHIHLTCVSVFPRRTLYITGENSQNPTTKVGAGEHVGISL